jgi:hypothetical protein
MEAEYFRGPITRLQYPPPTLPDSAFPTRARLASGCLADSAGRDSVYDLHPLGSFCEFQLFSLFLASLTTSFRTVLSWRDVILLVIGIEIHSQSFWTFCGVLG